MNITWAVEGERGLLLAVVKVQSADNLVVLLHWAGLWEWDQGWVLLDKELWQLIDLVGSQALASNGLLHDLPVRQGLEGWLLNLLEKYW